MNPGTKPISEQAAKQVTLGNTATQHNVGPIDYCEQPSSMSNRSLQPPPSTSTTSSTPMYYCVLCGFYSKDSEKCVRCNSEMTQVTRGHRAKCINGICGHEWEVDIRNLNGCPKCKAPRVMLIPPKSPEKTEERVFPRPHLSRLTYAFIAIDVLVVYWSQNVRRPGDPTAGKILESLSKLKVATLGDLWNLGENDRKDLPEDIFKEQFQVLAIFDLLVVRNGVFLDDEPMPSEETLTLEEPPAFGYEVRKCLKKDAKEQFQDVDLPKPEGWNEKLEKAWQNFLQEESCIKDYERDIKQIKSPPQAAWPIPPPMKLDEGSKELLGKALNMDTAYIGAANIYTGIVYVFPLVPHPCYFSDYSEGDDIPDGYYRAKDGSVPFVYRPSTRIVSKSQALMSSQVGGSNTAGIKADCPNFKKVWVWDTGELLHGIFHKTAPPVIYRLVAPTNKETAASAHIKLVQSVLKGSAADYVGFTLLPPQGTKRRKAKISPPQLDGMQPAQVQISNTTGWGEVAVQE